ncbi:MAG: hypothetical protein AB7S26_25975 [Sandaracinaceae bacterium]
MRHALSLALSALTVSGCYLSHERPPDGGFHDAGRCMGPPRGPVTLSMTVVSADGAGCPYVGFERTGMADLSGVAPVFPHCDTSVTASDDGCMLEIDGECLAVENIRQFHGTLVGPNAEGDVSVHSEVGIVSATCDLVERWRIVP